MPRRANSASRRTCCASATSSSRKRCLTRPRPARFTTPATSPRTWCARRRSPTGTASTSGLPPRRSAGKLRGIGLATYVEACGNIGPETATLRLDKDGGVTVLIGSQSTGQGHATAYAQIVAQATRPAARKGAHVAGRHRSHQDRRRHRRLELNPVRRRLARRRGEKARRADQEACGGCAGGISRAISKLAPARCGSPAPTALFRLRSWRRGRRPSPSSSPQPTPGRREQPTYPNGTHVVEVEVDPATGMVAIVKYVVVDDFGMTLNPLMLAGQVHGGAVQGIGQALMEDTAYDSGSGQLVSASLMDYALPRATHAPHFIFETRNVPCKTNPLGVKGAGEAGRDRLMSRRDQRHRRCAVARVPGPHHRHAGDAATSLGSDRGRPPRSHALNADRWNRSAKAVLDSDKASTGYSKDEESDCSAARRFLRPHWRHCGHCAIRSDRGAQSADEGQ